MAVAVAAGRKRKATVTGTMKNARRTCENGPPESAASRLKATMSTPVERSESRGLAGRSVTHASRPALQAEKTARTAMKATLSGSGWARLSLSASRPIAGSRSHATSRSASAAALSDGAARPGTAPATR